MANKYIVNQLVAGYTSVEIDDRRLLENDKSFIIVALTEDTSNELSRYYNSIRDILLTNSKLMVVIVGKESKIRKHIMNLMANYRNYNIYKVDGLATIDITYCNNICNREPSLDEVQQFIGGDVSAYSELSAILTGVKALAEQNDVEHLKGFIEQHYDSIDSCTELIEYMKKIVDTTNSGELTGIISNLKEKLADSARDLTNSQVQVKELRALNEELQENTASLQQEMKRVNAKVASLQEAADNASSGIITTYSEINTPSIKCVPKHILYVKELSYVRYMNSLITYMVALLKTSMNLNVKVIIYDAQVGVPVYAPLSVVSYEEYKNNKSNFIKSTEQFVVIEPNPAILTDILTSLTPSFDVVIVYDRMRQVPDIVSGNNVAKMFVINSKHDFEACKQKLRITETSTIIAGHDSDINDLVDDTIFIPTISGYASSTKSARTAKYRKMQDQKGNNIMDFIFGKLRIDTQS